MKKSSQFVFFLFDFHKIQNNRSQQSFMLIEKRKKCDFCHPTDKQNVLFKILTEIFDDKKFDSKKVLRSSLTTKSLSAESLTAQNQRQ